MKIFIVYTFLSALLMGCNLTGSGSSSGSGAPSGSTYSSSTGHSVQLNWTASSGSPQGYYIEQSTNGTTFTQVQSVTTTSATITGLNAGTVYYFRIRSYNSGGDSSYTATQTVTTPSN
jgi:hypothetical protein